MCTLGDDRTPLESHVDNFNTSLTLHSRGLLQTRHECAPRWLSLSKTYRRTERKYGSYSHVNSSAFQNLSKASLGVCVRGLSALREQPLGQHLQRRSLLLVMHDYTA